MEFYLQQNTTMEKYQKDMVNIGKYIKALHSASGQWEVIRLIELATSQVTWKIILKLSFKPLCIAFKY